MNKIKECFEKNSIKYVLFDMDRTLVDTGPYFQKRMFDTVLELVKKIFENRNLAEQKEITENILKISSDFYRKTYSPMLVDQLTLLAVEKYLSENKIGYHRDDIELFLKEQYKDFYNISPSLFPYTTDTLNQIDKLNIKMGVYSHAQDSWTKKKVDKIKQEYKEKYNRDLDLSFFTTDINDSKDSLGWKKAAKHLNFTINNTLVIGDSLTSDIYPAIDAGYKYIVYLHHSNPIPKIEGSADVYITENLGTIFHDI